MGLGEKFIVVTSVNPPSEAVKEFSRLVDWTVVVVGDKKTPYDWKYPGVVYLSVADQEVLYKSFCSSLPYNKYVRKMVGYLYCVRNGASVIYETDDDNIPYRNFSRKVDKFVEGNVLGKVCMSKTQWVNVYSLFGANYCWPRGFPLELKNQKTLWGLRDADMLPILTQFVVDGDPDVDAVYRMVVGKSVWFDEGKRFDLEVNCRSPINSQSTLWAKEVFPLMYLPKGLPCRVVDIFRGYLVAECLSKMGKRVTYASPVSYQIRNPHNLYDDFMQELLIYKHAVEWSEILCQSVKGATLVECFKSGLECFVDIGVLESSEINQYEKFLFELGV